MAHFKYFICFLFVVSISAQSIPDKKIDNLINEGNRYLLNQNYFAADSIFKLLETDFVDLPIGSVYRAANSIAKSLDYGEIYDNVFIESKLESAVELSEKLLDNDENNIWNNYFMAMSKGYLAYFLALEEDYIDAFSEGYFSISFFDRCLAIDPKFYESNIAKGTFLYWKSEKAYWIPFVNNDKQKGINFLENVIKQKTYNYYIAANSLLWIYINENNTDKAIETANSILTEYPGNRYFQLGLARAYEDKDKLVAIKIYSEVLKSLSSINKLNVYNEVTLKHIIAQIYERIGNYKSALFYCSEILAIQFLNEKELDRIEDRLIRVKEQKDRLLKLINGE